MADRDRSSTTAHTTLVLLALAAICNASGVDAQERRPSARSQRLTQEMTDFVLGNVEFMLLHELAHFLIEEKEIPIIGPEENAADYLATMALLRTEPFEDGHEDQTLDFLFAAANAFSASWKLGSAIGAEIPYWGNHALGIQRYYQIACLVYGSNPAAFAEVPGTTGLPATRADHCVAEFEQANKSVDWLLETYGRQPGDPRGIDVEIVYENAPTSVSRALVEQIRRARLFELTLERLEELFALEMPFVLAVRDCDIPEAAWIAERRELVVCYELIETIYLLSLL